MRQALVIGHSHTNALLSALKSSNQSDVSVMHLLGVGSELGIEHSQLMVKGEDGSTKFAQAVTDKFDGKPASAIFSMIGGNVNYILGLIQITEPFDFVLPFQKEVPMGPGFHRLTFESVCARLAEQAKIHLMQISALSIYAHSRGVPIYHLESPPPIGNDDFIYANLDPYFQTEKFKDRPLTPKFIRYKLWRAHSLITERHCVEAGVRFIRVPSVSQDADGFLFERYFPDNVTHANELYGRLLIDQVSDILAGQQEEFKNG